MDNSFIRNIGALTEEECFLLKQKKVFVAGCGGLGGNIIEYLTRIGIGEIVACDGDSFDETNLNRQLLSRTDNLGHPKAIEAEKRAKSIFSEIKFNAVTEFLTEENCEKLVGRKEKIIVEGESKNNPEVLTGRTDGNKVVNFVGDKTLIGKMIEVEIVEQRKWYLEGRVL